MKVINIQEAKTHLSRLVEEVLAGEERVIARAGKPLVKLVPYEPPKQRITLGCLEGEYWEAPDAWDPDPELEAFFYGEHPEQQTKVAEEKPQG
ncbi:MAG: type II toxin-antitoxin system Phd/YefM family antitoxin [Opitutales bacterium]